MRRIALVPLVLAVALVAYASDAKLEQEVAYGGWPNCLRLANGSIELIITTDVGPRVIRLGFVGGHNLFKEFEQDMGQTGGDAWRPYGGHRLWHAPEAKPRTYAPDNSPIDFAWDGAILKLMQRTEPDTGIQKVMEIALAQDDHVEVLHRLVNHNPWDVELAPWALTMMAQGGRAIYPQAPYRAHTDYLLPARPLVLWHYTDMSDPRWTWGEKYIQFRQDPNAAKPNKVGFRNAPGWAAYVLKKNVFIKRYALDPDGAYPDFGCNTETFSNADMLEIETLGPMTCLASDGGQVEHVEHWFLFKADIGNSEAAIDADLMPLIRRTDKALEKE